MFTLKDRKVQIKAQDLFLADMKKIYEEDKSQNKEDSTKHFTYIHLVSQIDPEAPFYRAPLAEVVKSAKKEIYGDPNYLFDDEEAVDELVTKYQQAHSTPEWRIIKSFDTKIDQLRDLMDETVPEIKETKNGTFAANTQIIVKTLQDIESIIKSRDALIALAKKEESTGGRVRADAKPGLLELSNE